MSDVPLMAMAALFACSGLVRVGVAVRERLREGKLTRRLRHARPVAPYARRQARCVPAPLA